MLKYDALVKHMQESLQESVSDKLFDHSKTAQQIRDSLAEQLGDTEFQFRINDKPAAFRKVICDNSNNIDEMIAQGLMMCTVVFECPVLIQRIKESDDVQQTVGFVPSQEETK